MTPVRAGSRIQHVSELHDEHLGRIPLPEKLEESRQLTLDAVRRVDDATTLQVLVCDKKMASGVCTTWTVQQEALLEKFWPGLFSVTVKAQPGLTWNLGDDRRLGKVNLRAPNKKFISALLEQSGPLATSSAALVGKPTILDLNTLNIYESDVGAIFDEAVLPAGPLSTWVEFSENEITLQRVGAISLEQLQALVPTISAPTL